MKNLLKFLFFIVSFSILGIGTQKATAACGDLSIVPNSPQIVLVGGTYYYSIAVLNSGTTSMTSGVDITIATTEFAVNNIASASFPDGQTTTLLFEINTDIATITTPSFAVITNLTFTSIAPTPCTHNIVGIVYTTSWGCTDPTAINYDPSATFDNNSCLEHICDLLQIIDAEIVYSSTGETVLEVTVVNNSTYNLPASTTITPNITGSTPVFSIPNGIPESMPIFPGPGTYTAVQFPILSPLSNLVGSTLLLTGHITITAPSIPDVCQIDFALLPIIISNLGCTDITAFNYDQYATVDNNTCVTDLEITPSIIHPICAGDPGSLSLNISGGTPNYTPSFGLQDPDNLLPGTYTFSVTDNTPASIGGPITQTYSITIDHPPLFEVQIGLVGTTTLQAWVNSNFSGWYYWLLDGEVIDSSQVPTYVYTTPGTYTCYVETDMNSLGQQCWDYSNGIILTQIGTDEYNKQGLTLYPNPSQGTFAIDLENYSSSNVIAQIYNIQGKEVYSLTTDDFNGQLIFDDINLQSGLYQIRIQNGDDLFRAKIVIE